MRSPGALCPLLQMRAVAAMDVVSAVASVRRGVLVLSREGHGQRCAADSRNCVMLRASRFRPGTATLGRADVSAVTAGIGFLLKDHKQLPDVTGPRGPAHSQRP